MYCLAYKNDQPRIVIGPDYWFSIVEIALANLITIGLVFVPAVASKNWTVLAGGLVILGLQNLTFMLTVCAN